MHSSSLILFTLVDGSGERRPLPPLPEGISSILHGAGLTLNHGILVGEALGIENRLALTIINEVYEAEDELPRCFVSDDLLVLRETYQRTQDALDEGMDECGRLRGTVGERLARSTDCCKLEDGSWWFADRQLSLLELRERIARLIRMIQFALDHDLWLEWREMSEPIA
jgi:hypothetical protein